MTTARYRRFRSQRHPRLPRHRVLRAPLRPDRGTLLRRRTMRQRSPVLRRHADIQHAMCQRLHIFPNNMILLHNHHSMLIVNTMQYFINAFLAAPMPATRTGMDSRVGGRSPSLPKVGTGGASRVVPACAAATISVPFVHNVLNFHLLPKEFQAGTFIDHIYHYFTAFALLVRFALAHAVNCPCHRHANRFVVMIPVFVAANDTKRHVILHTMHHTSNHRHNIALLLLRIRMFFTLLEPYNT